MPVPSVTARTNSLVITGLPPAFFHPNALEALRSVFEGFGEVYAWAPIRSFSRVLIVYYNEDDAESAKSGADGLHIDATSGRLVKYIDLNMTFYSFFLLQPSYYSPGISR